MRYKFLFTISFLFCYFQLSAQNGSIRGTVFDKLTGEFLPGVTIYIENTTKGTITDMDGKFNLNTPAGTFDLRISFISYETVSIKEITLNPGEVYVIDEVGLEYAKLGINEVVITAQTVRNTDVALNSIKMKSANLIDGISSTSLKRIGDSDAASSMKRVPGVSIEGGKYVFVRGLGDRYTKTILNGVDIPGLDPDRNSLQMDIFPTNIIDNIIVHKSFNASLPADFTGGVIDIEIIDFPIKKKSNLSLSAGYNPAFHFQEDFLTYEGGKTDFLGIDDGSREIPASTNVPEFALVVGNPDGEKGIRYKEILNSFNPLMASMQQSSLMDYSFGYTVGNQLPKEKVTLGYNLSFSYKNSTEFYKNTIDGKYGLSATPSNYQMEVREYQTGNIGINNTFLNGLAGFAVKTKSSKYRIYLLHLQNGEKKAGVFDFTGSDQGSDFVSEQHNLEFSQRSLSNILIDGKHNFSESNWDVSWKISPTLSVLNDPDIRFTRYEIGGGGVPKIGTEVGFPERIWRELSEINISGLSNASKNFKFRDKNANLKFGGSYTFKQRDYSIKKYLLNIRGGNGVLPLTGDPNELLTDALKWPYNGNVNYGTSFENDFNKSNLYNASVNSGAAFFSTELYLLPVLKTSVGMRLENYVQNYTGQDQSGANVLLDDEVLNDLDLFPSLNLILELSEKQNLRLSYSNTIARPSMKEISYAEIYDPISGTTFIGGLHKDKDVIRNINYWEGDLQSSKIMNVDIRWEKFFADAQMISLSGFYKGFKNPIEIVQFATQVGAFQPRNVGDGEVYGFETEIRANFLTHFIFSSNFTFTRSQIKLSDTEYNSKLENARLGQKINTYRDMAGQAPLIFNTSLFFSGSEKGILNGFEAGFFYNVQGSTLQFVGIADRPDIYSKPFHSLNFNSTKKFGNENRMQLGLKIENILNDQKESVFQSFKADDQYFSFRDQGISFSFSFSYSFQ